MTRVLVIDDDAVLRDNILELLVAEGFEVDGAADGKAGVAAALRRVPDVIVCDVSMPVMDGHRVLEAIRRYPETEAVPFIFLSARARRSDVREGMDLGADDYLTKPYTHSELLGAIRSRLARASVLSASPSASPTAPAPQGPVVRSEAIRAVWDEAMRAARTDLSVLLLGETGTGKDVLAHAIHKASPRAEGPFVPLNCAAISENLLESELFGHEKGAFTGAATRKPGLFESATGGTVFLDEVGDLPPSVQVKLLRVLEDRRVLSVGGRQYVDLDVRILTATNRDLEADIDAGHFRSDLFYRIATVVLQVPPLRDRRADIGPLATRFATSMAHRHGRARAPSLSPDALAALEAAEWRGNVRELRNVVERAVAFCDGDVLGLEHLPAALGSDDERASRGLLDDVRLRGADLERRRIIETLEQCAGNQTRAAGVLGISRRTLINRLERYGLDRPRKGRD